MPRGNDSSQAAVDLRGSYGVDANAEQLIRSHRSSLTPQLRAAMNISRVELSDEDHADLLKKLDSKVDDGNTVVDAAVRGDYVVAVVEVPSGRTFKQVFPHSELGGPKARRAGALVEESEDDVAEREAQEEHIRTVAAAAEAERAAREAAEEARQKKLAELEKDREKKASGSGSKAKDE